MQPVEIIVILIVDALVLAWGWGSKPNDTSRPIVAGIIILISLVEPIIHMMSGASVSPNKRPGSNAGSLRLSKNLFKKKRGK